MDILYNSNEPDPRIIPSEALSPEVKSLIGKLEFARKRSHPVTWINPILLVTEVVAAVKINDEPDSLTQ